MFKLGMNMVRFWGGGNYPPEEVYSECDKLGILIWQDLMFSGTIYPKRDDWKIEVGNEIDANISWMKTHPSLALICGNNEIEVALKNWGWFQKYHLKGADSLKTWTHYRQLFDTFIPRKLQNIVPNIFYLSSSPVGNWGNLKQMKFGDNHDWGVWHGERNFNHVDSVNAPFVSEFGFPSLPNGYKESVDSTSYQYLQFRSYKGLKLLNRYSKNEPKNSLNYLVVPQLKNAVLNATKLSASGRTQALFLDRAIRAYRTSGKDFGGCLFWQWNDVDRVVSWSVVDVDFNQKPAFEQFKYSLKPVTSFVRYSDSSLKVSIQSNAFKTQNMTIQLSIENNQKMSVFKATKILKVTNFAEAIFLVNPAFLKANNHVRLKVLDAQGNTLDEL
jgi:beta-mannosidase